MELAARSETSRPDAARTRSVAALRVRASALVAGASAMVVLLLMALGALERFEAATVDLRFRLASDATRADSRIVIVNIGQGDLEAASKQLGLHWPWPRQVYAELLARLAPGQPRAVFFDLFFTEPSAYSASDDRAFAAAIQRAGNVYLPGMFRTSRRTLQPLGARSPELDALVLPRLLAIDIATDGSFPGRIAAGLTLPVDVLAEALAKSSRGLVDVTFLPDPDQVGRHYPLLVEHAGALYPSAALRMAADLLATSPSIRDGALWLENRKVTSHCTKHRASRQCVFPLRFHGGHRTYSHYGFTQVMSSTHMSSEELRRTFSGRIVLVGSDAAGLLDLRPSPFDRAFSGVEFHATALDNLISGTALRSASRPLATGLIVMLALGAALLVAFLPGPLATAGVCGLGLAYAGGAFASFRYMDVRMDLVATELAMALSYAGAAMWRAMTEGRRRKEARHALEHFLPPAVVRKVLRDPAQLALGGQKQEITIFFSDLAGFTDLSEQLAPELLVDLINDYLTAVCSILQDEGATIDKYVGDAIVAFFGAPLPQSDHALRACRAALRAREELARFATQLRERGLPELAARTGIHTGHAVVGFMGFRSGSGGRFNYTMMGDAVNLGARLEGVNKRFGTQILASETTVDQARDEIEVRELGAVRVKGRRESTRIYELLASRGELSATQEAVGGRFQVGLSEYRSRSFEAALRAFEACLEHDPQDTPARVYRDLCRNYLQAPPGPHWDPVHALEKL